MDPKTPTLVVSSGKGGVGKTTSAALLSIHLGRAGVKVGLLDCDIKDPNLPQVLRLNGAVEEYKHKYVSRDAVPSPYPFSYDGVSFPVFSSAFLFGPKRGILSEGSTVRQLVVDFIHEVAWPKLDLLLVDLDPSAGDSVRAVRDTMKRVAAIIIAEDDASTLSDCGRQVDAFESPEMKVPVLGVVGNRIGYTGPPNAAAEEATIRTRAAHWGVPYLGSLPFDPTFRTDPLKAISTTGAPLGAALVGTVKGWIAGG